MKKTVYLSAFVFAAAISLIGCGDPLLDDLNSNIEVGSGDLSIAENYEQAAGMFLTHSKKCTMSEHRTVHTSIKYNSTFTSTIIRDTWPEHKILAGTCPLPTGILRNTAMVPKPVFST